jgi:hypothetical protein
VPKALARKVVASGWTAAAGEADGDANAEAKAALIDIISDALARLKKGTTR